MLDEHVLTLSIFPLLHCNYIYLMSRKPKTIFYNKMGHSTALTPVQRGRYIHVRVGLIFGNDIKFMMSQQPVDIGSNGIPVKSVITIS